MNIHIFTYFRWYNAMGRIAFLDYLRWNTKTQQLQVDKSLWAKVKASILIFCTWSLITYSLRYFHKQEMLVFLDYMFVGNILGLFFHTGACVGTGYSHQEIVKKLMDGVTALDESFCGYGVDTTRRLINKLVYACGIVVFFIGVPLLPAFVMVYYNFQKPFAIQFLLGMYCAFIGAYFMALHLIIRDRSALLNDILRRAADDEILPESCSWCNLERRNLKKMCSKHLIRSARVIYVKIIGLLNQWNDKMQIIFFCSFTYQMMFSPLAIIFSAEVFLMNKHSEQVFEKFIMITACVLMVAGGMVVCSISDGTSQEVYQTARLVHRIYARSLRKKVLREDAITFSTFALQQQPKLQVYGFILLENRSLMNTMNAVYLMGAFLIHFKI